MSIVEISWPVVGLSIPRDHGYLLWAALAEKLPALYHEPGLAIGPIWGREMGDRLLLGPKSVVRMRLPALETGEALALTGANLKIGLDAVILGAATIEPLRPARALTGHVLAGACVGEAIELKIRTELGTLPTDQDRWSIGVRVGAQRLLRTRRGAALTHRVTLSGLTAHASIVLQGAGIGGRRHLGAGFFEPAA